MANIKFDKDEGVWRTIGGRRIFIRTGKSISQAMKESGKFKKAEKTNTEEEKQKKLNETMEKRASIINKLDEETKDLNEYDKYNLAVSKLETNDYSSPTEKQYWAGEISRYKNKAPGQQTMDTIKENNVKTFGDEIKENNYRNKITDVAKNSKEDNVTLDVETGKPVNFEKGYSVSFQQSSDNYSDEEYHAKVEECRKKCDGKVYAGKYGGDAEASFHTDSLDDAKEIMYKYNQESIYDWQHETLIMNDKYDSSKNVTNYKAKKTTNDIMNEKIRAGATKKKFKEDLPKAVEIKTQGTSNRKEVSENIQAHILEHYDSPDDFIKQMDVMKAPTMWRAGEEIARGGSYLVYNQDMADFLDELKINPKGKKFSSDKAFNTYTSLVGRESAKLYERLKRNAYKKYLFEHPGSTMSFSDFKEMVKGGK